MRNPYDVLGVTPECTQGEITKAYRKLAQKLHPDKPGGNAEEFNELRQAYEQVGSVDARKAFDSGIEAITEEDVALTIRKSMHAALEESLTLPLLPRLVTFFRSEHANIERQLKDRTKRLRLLQLNKQKLVKKGDGIADQFGFAIEMSINNLNDEIKALSQTKEMLSRCQSEVRRYVEGPFVEPAEDSAFFDPGSEFVLRGSAWRQIGR